MKHAEKHSLYRAMVAQIFADGDTFDIVGIAKDEKVILHSTVCACDLYHDTITKYVCAYGYEIFNNLVMDIIEANIAKVGNWE